MNRDRNALRAGIFIVVAVLLAIGVIIGVKGTARLLEPKQHLIISFPLAADVGGLRRGDDLRIGGYKVGAVDHIELSNTDDPSKARADVYVTLPKKYIVHEDANAMIQSTFTGQSWINIQSLGNAAPLGEDARLTGNPAAFTAMINELAQMGPELRAIIHDVRVSTVPKANVAIDQIRETAKTYQEVGEEGKGLVSNIKGKIDPLSDKTGNFLDRGAEMMVQVRDLIGDTKIDFRTAVANIRAATNTVKEKLPVLMDNMDNAVVKLTNTIDSLDGTLNDARGMIADAKTTVGGLHDVVVNNKSKLTGIIDSLKITSDNLKATSAQVRASPWRLLYQPSGKEQQNFRIITTAREFADGATQLNDAANALRDAANNPNTNKEDLAKLMKQLDDQFGKFQVVEKQLWKDIRK